MAETLFPVFPVPEINVLTAAKERKYRRSVYFDYETGDFLRDGSGNMVPADGREAYRQWCLKTVMTERFTCLSYTTDIGTEMIEALAHADRAAVESAVERTINEALMVNGGMKPWAAPSMSRGRIGRSKWSALKSHCDRR